MKTCKIKGCNNSAAYKDNGCNGYCSKHYQQMKLHGKILKRTRYDENKIIDCGDYCEICLYSGCSEQKEIARTKIDKNDLDKVKKYKWGLNKQGYVRNASNKKFLHQLILGKKKGFITDHKNLDPLNNRKQNLRFATHQQNQMNRKCKGYYWDKIAKKWMAYIEKNKKRICLGLFTNKQDAIKARRKGELKYFGDFAYKN